MPAVAKTVLRAATRSDRYWNLSDAEKLIWMIERAYRLGKTEGQRKHNAGKSHFVIRKS